MGRFIKFQQLLIIIILTSLALRFLTLGMYDLYDTTEARYAGIAFRMAETKDFLTPWIFKGEPFLGKPPLSFWITAIFFKAFGSYHEFVARLPHFLAMVLVCLLGYFFLKKTHSKTEGLLSIAILTSFPMFYILAGSVMTDAWLVLGVSLTNIGFFLGTSNKFDSKNSRNYYGWLFVFGIIISILSKGLVGVVISGCACFFYTLLRQNFKSLLKLPIFLGPIVICAFSLPWFILMEKSHPGFLEYFFIGEHFKRFLIAKWDGDQYGNPHSKPLGTIWLFFVISTAQWFIYFLYFLIKKRKAFVLKKIDDTKLFLILQILSPLLIFTFAKNIITPYTGAAIPPFAMLLGILFVEENVFQKWKKTLILLTIPFSVSVFFICLFFNTFVFKYSDSDKPLILAFEKEADIKDVLYYLETPGFSSYFYSKDKIVHAKTGLSNENIKFFVSSNEHPDAKKLKCYNHRCLYLYLR